VTDERKFQIRVGIESHRDGTFRVVLGMPSGQLYFHPKELTTQAEADQLCAELAAEVANALAGEADPDQYVHVVRLEGDSHE
jgi:hypothetical protein